MDFKPVEILFFRFIMGFLVLLIICPHRLKGVEWKQETTFIASGLSGICLYYLLENIALTYTLASNVDVIISVAPFFTAILAHGFMKSEEKLRVNFFVGLIVAIAGIILISFNGSKLELKPKGDILAIIAAFVWAFYSILTKKISSYGYPVILTTRRTFFYGILFMIPTLLFFDFNIELSRFTNITYLLNILYLGLGASALCFVTWNFAVKILGAVKTSVYIYMVPVITVVTSVVKIHYSAGTSIKVIACTCIIKRRHCPLNFFLPCNFLVHNQKSHVQKQYIRLQECSPNTKKYRSKGLILVRRTIGLGFFRYSLGVIP